MPYDGPSHILKEYHKAWAQLLARASKGEMSKLQKICVSHMDLYLLKYWSQPYDVIHFWNPGRLRIPIKTIWLVKIIYFVLYDQKAKKCRKFLKKGQKRHISETVSPGDKRTPAIVFLPRFLRNRDFFGIFGGEGYTFFNFFMPYIYFFPFLGWWWYL